MAGWQELYSNETIPTREQVEDYVKSPLWRELNSYLRQTYEIEPKTEYSCCSMQSGWNIKYKKSGKSLCTLYPMPGYFIALVVIGAKEMPEAEFLIHFCSDYVQGVFAGTQEGQGQKWLMLDVKNETTFEDVIKLIDLRVKARKKEGVDNVIQKKSPADKYQFI